MSEATFYRALLIAWFALAGVTFLALQPIVAPYGRHARPGWGATLPNRVGWILMESPAVLGMLACLLIADPAPIVWFFGGLWLVHYVHRALLFPFRLRDGGKRMPLLIAASGFAFNVGNAYLNGRGLTAFQSYPGGWWLDPRFLGGVAVFAAGFAINLHADHVLLTLRRPGETGYRIPHGGLYRWISCPNYLGEILEWVGWAIATWSPFGLAFAVWTFANLAPRARAHHRWYRERFADYPPGRRSLVPGLF